MISKEALSNTTPYEVLQELLAGNERFVTNSLRDKNYPNEIKNTIKAQYPSAIVLGCVDSRVPVEIIFDQAIGDLFVSRVAGNFENDDILASMEYACKVVGSKLIMVLGHSGCGAVKATCDDVKMGHITDLVSRIKPAITKTSFDGEVSSKNKECVDAVAKTNVSLTIQRIREKSTILKELEDNGNIKIQGAFYDISRGKVSLLD